MKLILSGSALTAVEFAAYMPGLQVVPVGDVLKAARNFATEIAEKSAPVVALAKQAIVAGT